MNLMGVRITSNFTVSVYELIESGFDFGLNDYSFFNETYRPLINEAILERYKWKEIAYQNPIQWRDRLRERMKRIMLDKYNDLLKAKETEFNPLNNVEMKETFTHEINNTNVNNINSSENSNNSYSNNSETETENSTTETNNTSNKSKSFQSDYPTTQINNEDYDNDIYLSGANHNNYIENVSSKNSTNSNTSNNEDGDSTTKTTSTSNSNGENKTIETYTRINSGSSAGLPLSKALIQYKEFIEKYAILTNLCDELSDLFINVYAM